MPSSVSEARRQMQPFILNRLPMKIVFSSVFYRVRKRKCESWHSDGAMRLWTERVNLMKTEIGSTVFFFFFSFTFLSVHAFPEVSSFSFLRSGYDSRSNFPVFFVIGRV